MLQQYQQVIEQYRQRVYSFAHYSLRAREDAEDVTQEVFIKLWQHWRKIDQARLGAWLMRVAHNSVIDHVRRQKPGKDNRDQYSEVEEQEAESDPGSEVESETFRLELQQAIRALEEPFRSIVIMRDIQGMSYEEIRECLQMSESQVKVYLHRSRRKLRENRRLREIFSAATGASLPEAGSRADKARQSE
ncbi:MAG: sigma-70 family RNA polymerase sigma factor [Pseudomonadales bacterium]|nr:sigma-70 family RNA polymerase sigma factor [Pseudomonadales bacterium]